MGLTSSHCLLAVILSLISVQALAHTPNHGQLHWNWHSQRIQQGEPQSLLLDSINAEPSTASSSAASARIAPEISRRSILQHSVRPHSMHALMQDSKDNRVAVVTSTAEFIEAVEDSVPHIRIFAHLDLTSTAVDPESFNLRILASLKSITGHCLDTPVPQDLNLAPQEPLLPLADGQCLLVTQYSVLTSSSGPLWLDNLYFRRERLPSHPSVDGPVDTAGVTNPLVVIGTPEGVLWATQTVFQSDGAGGAVGVEVHSEAFFEGCTFAGFRGGSIAVRVMGATVSFVSSEFVGNSGDTDGQADGLIHIGTEIASSVRLQACVLWGNDVDYTAVDVSSSASSQIYSDDAQVTLWRVHTQELAMNLPLDAPGVDFVDRDRSWFTQTVQEASSAGGGHKGVSAQRTRLLWLTLTVLGTGAAVSLIA